jgi:HK97 family phage major capsid protein
MTYEQQCERLNAASQEIDVILKASDDEKRPLTDADRDGIEALETELTGLKTAIDQHKADAELRKRQDARRKMLATEGPGRTAPPAQPGAADTLTDKPKIVVPRHYGSLRSFTGPDAQLNAYKSGMFCLSIFGHPEALATKRAREFCGANGIELLAQIEDSNTAGGFLVFPEFSSAIIDLRETFGVFRREAKVEPMASDTKTVPRRVSGLTAYYVDENVDITESEKGWDQVRLTARKIGILTKYSSELNEDSIISMADDLAAEMAFAFASKEDDEGFLGDGTSTYGGISGLITECTAATATVVTALAGNIAFSKLDLVDFESMIGKLPQYAENNAKWYISKTGWAASMLRLIDAAGGNTGAMIAGAAPKEFLGYPVIISQKMNTTLTDQTSTNGIAYLGNLRQAAMLGDRRGITIATSDQRYFESDQLAIRGTSRHDINVHDVGSTSVAGSMIMLAMPGA